MRGVRTQVDGSATLAREAGEAIVRIREGAVEVVDVARGITVALREQGSTSDIIARKIENIAHSSAANTQALKQSAEAVQVMEQLAGEMRDSVSRFKV
jgi:methyl-accepting chemotaxis protein